MARRFPFLPAAAVVALALGLLIAGVYVSKASDDPFRLPKELAFRTEAILLLLIGVFIVTRRRGSWGELVRGIAPAEWGVCLAIALWTAITTFTSQNRPLSEESIVTVLAAIVIFLATRRLAPHLPLLAFELALIPVIINAVIALLQEYRIWNPFTFPAEALGHQRTTGLIGNPNDVGSYIVGPAVATVIAAFVVRGWRRWIYVALLPVEVAGMIATGTRTALVAFVAGVVVFVLLRPLRQALVAAAILTVVIVFATRPSTLLGQLIGDFIDAAQHRQYNVVFSERLVPFLSAVDMARNHPLAGVGPGCFKYEFMDARFAIEEHYPKQWTRGWPQNFGETHNDHLQVMAETGLPGYALFVAAVLLVAIRWRRPPADAPQTPERIFAHTLRAPLAVTFFVLALAQFPLQIAAPRLMFLTLAGLATGWDPSDA